MDEWMDGDVRVCLSVCLGTLWVRPHLFCVSVRLFGDIIGAYLPRNANIFRKNKNDVPMPESNAHGLLHGLYDF